MPERRGEAPWPGHEYVRGWGVFGLPFDSGHILALRVFPDNSFGPYRSVWHRDPDGRWSIFVDGDRVDTACPRYFGAACGYTGLAAIEVTWTGPASVRVTVDDPALEWTFTATETPALRLPNALGPRLPLRTWRSRSLLRAREIAAAALGMGSLRMSGTMPSGHYGTLMPEQMYLITAASAVLDGQDLGNPVRLAENPVIGAVALPARGVLAIGGGMWRIRTPDVSAR
ncbi:hypothetical protein FOH10_16040 [Nocardia otitidiscaviarum]|uniref:Uncharacterized protein n=1 Tax=Nocardia otitidiscaviarum TaxID=1823 RepID=A0A516NX87_9NOCA|nr:hypothetical protein [Nocardia otitidiscaviarum]QDP83529.1 hypothetical protein FOH10_16040 [Nocardia otitidiscaviarum]